MTPRRNANLALICAVGLTAPLAGCASYGAFSTPVQNRGEAAAPLSPALPPAARGRSAGADTPLTDAAIAGLTSAQPLNVALPPQPLPQLVNTVLGDLLGVPYVMAPEVAARTDIVVMRGGPTMSRRDLLRLLRSALETYGVQLTTRDGAVQVSPRTGGGEVAAADFLAARPDTSGSMDLQPVTQRFQASRIEVEALANLATAILPQARNLGATLDKATNGLTLSGPARDVDATLSLLRQLDQPRFAGASVFRVEPIYWSAESLARSLEDALRGEGFTGGDGAPAVPRSVMIVPFARANQILVFARDPAVIERARALAGKLDQPTGGGAQTATFVYYVRNTDAQSLASLVSSAGGAGASGYNPAPPGVPGAPPALTAALNNAGQGYGPGAQSGGGGMFLGGRVVVDPGGNRILFTGSADDFTQLRNLLLTLDAPLREVLVEVTIAEVTLTDETRVGLEWFFTHSGSRGVTSGGTLGNLGLGASGLKLKFTGTDLQAAFNAFASNNNVNILSRPRLVARSGGEAKIQVGTDVPIITSRANSSTQTGGSTDILQTITYRQTGVILQIRPLVYGDDRVDLEITQEVSSQQPNSNATIGSPLILNRNISTQLSLTEGATAVLGGLIDSSFTKGNSGIPFLKDIPILGSAFRSDTVNGGKTELVMLVTPHIVRDTEDMNRWARRYGDEMDDAFRIGRSWSYTLTPFTVRALGSDLAREKAVVAPGER